MSDKRIGSQKLTEKQAELDKIREFFDNATPDQLFAFLMTYIIPEKTW